MPSLKSLGSRDRIKTATVEPVPDWKVELTYRPGLITLANDVPDETDPEAPSAMAVRLCGDDKGKPGLISDWDITGPLEHSYTGESLVADGDVVPLDAQVVQHIEYAALAGLMQEMVRAETPSPRRTRR